MVIVIINRLLTTFTGDGRVGQDYTRNTTYTCGRLIAIHIFHLLL